MLLNLPQAEDMLFLPLVRKSQELSWLDFALELIDIHRVNTALEPLAFCIESRLQFRGAGDALSARPPMLRAPNPGFRCQT